MIDYSKKLKNIRDYSRDFGSLGLFSFRNAIISYFSSFSDDEYKDHFLDSDYFSINVNYINSYTQTIIHFHHFFEISLKSVLENINEVYIYDTKEFEDIAFLNSIIKNELNRKNIKNERFKTISLSKTLERLNQLKISNSELSQFLQKLSIENHGLVQLNTLRNEIFHRGIHFLEIKDFDDFIGKNILPSAYKLICNIFPESTKEIWKHGNMNIPYEPIEEIINHYEENSVPDYQV